MGWASNQLSNRSWFGARWGLQLVKDLRLIKADSAECRNHVGLPTQKWAHTAATGWKLWREQEEEERLTHCGMCPPSGSWWWYCRTRTVAMTDRPTITMVVAKYWAETHKSVYIYSFYLQRFNAAQCLCFRQHIRFWGPLICGLIRSWIEGWYELCLWWFNG